MTIDPAIVLAALSALVVALGTTARLIFMAVVKGDIVPGHIYLAEKAQREKAETEAKANAEVLAALARDVAALAAALAKRRPNG